MKNSTISSDTDPQWIVSRRRCLRLSVYLGTAINRFAFYLGDGVSTNCPSGGQYVVTGLTNPPACTIPGHLLANEGED